MFKKRRVVEDEGRQTFNAKLGFKAAMASERSKCVINFPKHSFLPEKYFLRLFVPHHGNLPSLREMSAETQNSRDVRNTFHDGLLEDFSNIGTT